MRLTVYNSDTTYTAQQALGQEKMRNKTTHRSKSVGSSLTKNVSKHRASDTEVSISGKEFIGEYLNSGKMLTESIRDTLTRMEIGDTRVIGPLPRRGDIGAVVARLNEDNAGLSFTQTRCYLFHPDSGKTVQMILVARIA